MEIDTVLPSAGAQSRAHLLKGTVSLWLTSLLGKYENTKHTKDTTTLPVGQTQDTETELVLVPVRMDTCSEPGWCLCLAVTRVTN